MCFAQIEYFILYIFKTITIAYICGMVPLITFPLIVLKYILFLWWISLICDNFIIETRHTLFYSNIYVSIVEKLFFVLFLFFNWHSLKLASYIILHIVYIFLPVITIQLFNWLSGPGLKTQVRQDSCIWIY